MTLTTSLLPPQNTKKLKLNKQNPRCHTWVPTTTVVIRWHATPLQRTPQVSADPLFSQEDYHHPPSSLPSSITEWLHKPGLISDSLQQTTTVSFSFTSISLPLLSPWKSMPRLSSPTVSFWSPPSQWRRKMIDKGWPQPSLVYCYWRTYRPRCRDGHTAPIKLESPYRIEQVPYWVPKECWLDQDCSAQGDVITLLHFSGLTCHFCTTLCFSA